MLVLKCEQLLVLKRDVANLEVCRFADLLDLMYHGETFINSNT